MVDDFGARDLDRNSLGGKWGAFSAGDRGDIVLKFVDDGRGGSALEADGVLPVFPGGVTWGGVYCDLGARREARDLRPYKALQFRARSEAPAAFDVRIENPRDTHKSTNVGFNADREFASVTIPLTAFSTGVGDSTVITWKLRDEKAGARFHLVLDDVKFVR
jgi:hypothetical protein